MSKSYDPLEKLAALVAHAGALPQQKRFDLTGHKIRRNPEPFDHVEHCSQALLSGALPSPETLLFVAIGLDRYVEAKGDLTLDEAFELRSKRKIGNPSKQRATKNTRLSLLWDMAQQRADDPSLTLPEAAVKVAGNDPTGNFVETLVREFKRYGCKTWV